MLIIIGLVVGIMIGVGILSAFLAFKTRLGNLEPEIITLSQSFRAVGLEMQTNDKTIFRDLSRIYRDYLDRKAKQGIPNMKTPWEYVSLSDHFDEGGQHWDYHTGNVVTAPAQNLQGFVEFAVPAGRFAVFPVRGQNKLTVGLMMGKIRRYIYGVWLPRSPWDFAGYECEYNNQTMHAANPYDVNIYVAVQEKPKA